MCIVAVCVLGGVLEFTQHPADALHCMYCAGVARGAIVQEFEVTEDISSNCHQ